MIDKFELACVGGVLLLAATVDWLTGVMTAAVWSLL